MYMINKYQYKYMIINNKHTRWRFIGQYTPLFSDQVKPFSPSHVYSSMTHCTEKQQKMTSVSSHDGEEMGFLNSANSNNVPV